MKSGEIWVSTSDAQVRIVRIEGVKVLYHYIGSKDTRVHKMDERMFCGYFSRLK